MAAAFEHGDLTRPLEGITVVAIEQALAAPLCTCRLADMGARVIKIERPEGDFARYYDAAAFGQSSYFVWANRGKESLVLDFKQVEDAALLHRILAKADIVVQNLAPGALTRAGFDSESLRQRYPNLITCDISGYGREGEASGLKAYDFLVQCESGLVGISGGPESCGRIGISICDIGAGLNATIGIMSALMLRGRTGHGSGISVSLFDSTADWMAVPYVHQIYGEGAPTRQGLKHPSIAPYAAFSTNDCHEVVISVQNEREWQQFCALFLLRPEVAQDHRFISNNDRVRNRESLDSMIAAVFQTLTLEGAIARLKKSNTAYGRVRSVAEFAVHPALRKLPMSVADNEMEMIASPVRTSWDRERFDRAPDLGEHSASLRTEFGIRDEKL